MKKAKILAGLQRARNACQCDHLHHQPPHEMHEADEACPAEKLTHEAIDAAIEKLRAA